MKNNQLLSGLSVNQFLRNYWQKKPLLIRNAFPGFKGLVNKIELISLAGQDEVISRLVIQHQKKWTVNQGPFRKNIFTKLKGCWSLLVQDVNHHLIEAAELLQHFNFIPHARLDDLMVSFAPNGGGVGPHFDSYDVFLLQGSGQRLWQISQQKDRTLLPNAPLRILKNFKPEQEWILNPGDMLYLPPNYAHNGIAVGDSMTYSIGFRAPQYQELAYEFLCYLQDHSQIEGIYQDPDLKLAKHPAQISDQMLNQVNKAIKKIRYNKNDIENFLGIYLTEPKPQVLFDYPETPIKKNDFLKKAKLKGIQLALKSQMLFTRDLFFLNGEVYSFHKKWKPFLKEFADARKGMLPTQTDNEMGNLIYQWYLQGYLFSLE